MLLNRLLDWLRDEGLATAFVFNSLLKPSHLFDFIIEDFEIPCESREKSQVLMRLNNWLLERYQAGRTAVVVIDEAQNLSFEVLEEIRLLTNLETSTAKLLQVVLCGQPELDEKLKLPQVRQLRQRITLRCHTSPLTLEETFGYVRERLRIAGANGEPIFSKEALELVHNYSQGIPRLVNVLCEHSMIGAYVDHLRPVPACMVEEVAREFQLDQPESGSLLASVSRAENVASTQALVQNLNDLLVRLRQIYAVPTCPR
jgi:general secretion pathway protein A